MFKRYCYSLLYIHYWCLPNNWTPGVTERGLFMSPALPQCRYNNQRFSSANFAQGDDSGFQGEERKAVWVFSLNPLNLFNLQYTWNARLPSCCHE